MTSSVDNTHARPRRHDSTAARQALLLAATELFEQRGYDATTVRAIGERAGIDAALIARYFGSKEALYLATFAEAERPSAAGEPVEMLRFLIRRTEARGMGPISLAMVSPTLTEPMRAQIEDVVASRLVAPLQDTLESRVDNDAGLRAELIVAAAVGISLARAAGTLPRLRDATLEQLLAAIGPALDVLGDHHETDAT